MSLTVILVSVACLTGGVALILLGLRQRRLARAAALAEAAAPIGAQEAGAQAAEAMTRKLEEMLDAHERRIVEAVSGLRDNLGELKSDVEWLAGERMIEQAIALARDGADPDTIGQELGLNRDTAATIAMFRRH